MNSNLPKKEYRNYLKSIKKELICSNNLKSAFISDFKERIAEYLIENPKALMSDLINELGNPKEIASSFGAFDLAKLKIKARKYFYAKILIVILIICLIIAAIFLFNYIISADDNIIITN